MQPFFPKSFFLREIICIFTHLSENTTGRNDTYGQGKS